MKLRFALLAVLLGTSLSFGQPFSVIFYNLEFVLRSAPFCGVGEPAPDGTIVEIRWDSNADGPSWDDPLPPLCNDPPLCEDGPAGTVNRNTFTINGEALGIGAGLFVTESAFGSVGMMLNPSRFFLVIRCPFGDLHYLSTVFTLQIGPQEVFLHDYDWTCWPCAPCCSPDLLVLFQQQPLPSYQCVNTCLTAPLTIRVCPGPGQPLLDPSQPPLVTIVSGCVENCDWPYCPPAEFSFNPDAWIYVEATGCWENVMIGLTDCACVCIGLEGFLSVEFNNDFVARPLDNTVELSWSTSSETNNDFFEIRRNGDVLNHIPSRGNSAAGYQYRWTDETAYNGATYEYVLAAVDFNGQRQELATQSATPNADLALVTEYALHQNYPNPFNPKTNITFDLLESGLTTVKVFDLMGREVSALVNGDLNAGRHTISFDGSGLASGVYLYRLDVNRFSAQNKMLLLR